MTTPVEGIRALFDCAGAPNLPPRWNVAPTDIMPVVRLDRDGRRELVTMRWGLIPYWAKDAKIGNRLINARGETVATTPAFRTAYRQRRCLVPADGFYEWQQRDGRKQAYYITPADGRLFAFAGLWERWRDPSQPQLALIESFSIVVTAANAVLQPLHDRMPVLIEPADFTIWLTGTDQRAVHALIRPAADDRVVATPVSAHVNNVRNDDPACIAPESAAPGG